MDGEVDLSGLLDRLENGEVFGNGKDQFDEQVVLALITGFACPSLREGKRPSSIVKLMKEFVLELNKDD